MLSGMEREINLANGQPAHDLLPSDLVSKAAADALRTSVDFSVASSPLNYGDQTAQFCQRVSEFLMQHDNRLSVDPSHIVPTSGVSHALDALCLLLCRRARSRTNAFVFVEDATYYLASDIFRDHGLDVRTVATDYDGIVVDDLLRQLEGLDEFGRDNDSSPWPVMLYMIPNFHNPTGRSISESRKKQLCEAAERFHLMVVADEVYNLLNYSALIGGISPMCRDPTSMSVLGSSNVISISSFSKILAPGLRVGWIEFPTAELASQYRHLGFFRSGSNTSQFSSCVVLKIIEKIDSVSGKSMLFTHISRLREIYAERYIALTNSIRLYSTQMLPPGYENQLIVEGLDDPNRAVGGYFIWVKVPEWAFKKKCVEGEFFDNGATALFKLAKSRFNLIVRLGSECASCPGLHSTHLRLCFAKLLPSELDEGARRLCLLLKSLNENSSHAII